MKKTTGFNVLRLKHTVFVPSARCHFNNITFECKGQEVDYGKQVDKGADQAHRLWSLNSISFAHWAEGKFARLHLTGTLLRHVATFVSSLDEYIARPSYQGISEGESNTADCHGREERLAIALPRIHQYRQACDREHAQRVRLCTA